MSKRSKQATGSSQTKDGPDSSKRETRRSGTSGSVQQSGTVRKPKYKTPKMDTTLEMIPKGAQIEIFRYMGPMDARTFARTLNKNLRGTLLPELNNIRAVTSRLRQAVANYVRFIYPYQQQPRTEEAKLVPVNPETILHALDVLARIIVEDAGEVTRPEAALAVKKEFLAYFYLLQAAYMERALLRLDLVGTPDVDYDERRFFRWRHGVASVVLRFDDIDYVFMGDEERDEQGQMAVRLLDDFDYPIATIGISPFTRAFGRWVAPLKEGDEFVYLEGTFADIFYESINQNHRAREDVVMIYEIPYHETNMQWRTRQTSIHFRFSNLPEMDANESIADYAATLSGLHEGDSPIATLTVISGRDGWEESINRDGEPTEPGAVTIRPLEGEMDFHWLTSPVSFTYLKAFECFIRSADMVQNVMLPFGAYRSTNSPVLLGTQGISWAEYRRQMPPITQTVAPPPLFADLEAKIQAYQATGEVQVSEFILFMQWYRSFQIAPYAILRHNGGDNFREVDWVPLIPGITMASADPTFQRQTGQLGLLDPDGDYVRIACAVCKKNRATKACDTCAHRLCLSCSR